MCTATSNQSNCTNDKSYDKNANVVVKQLSQLVIQWNWTLPVTGTSIITHNKVCLIVS